MTSRGTHSMICMLCDARVTCPWEQEVEPVAIAAGWVELPKGARRRTPHHVCGECADEALQLLLAREHDKAPYVCPGCHAVGGERCAADCIDAEIARDMERRDDEFTQRHDEESAS